MKKIFIVSALMLGLVACQAKQETAPDFTSLYNANVKAELKNSFDTWK